MTATVSAATDLSRESPLRGSVRRRNSVLLRNNGCRTVSSKYHTCEKIIGCKWTSAWHSFKNVLLDFHRSILVYLAGSIPLMPQAQSCMITWCKNFYTTPCLRWCCAQSWCVSLQELPWLFGMMVNSCIVFGWCRWLLCQGSIQLM